MARGAAAAGVAVSLLRREEGSYIEVGSGVTGADGRIANLLQANALDLGSYRLVFDLGTYFGTREHLFSRITLDLSVSEVRHHHVPLLLGPYSITSYRGT